MNLGVDSWRNWLKERIAQVIERFNVDAYFLDIAGGWENNTQADMHEGSRRLVGELRMPLTGRYNPDECPSVSCRMKNCWRSLGRNQGANAMPRSTSSLADITSALRVGV